MGSRFERALNAMQRNRNLTQKAGGNQLMILSKKVTEDTESVSYVIQMLTKEHPPLLAQHPPPAPLALPIALHYMTSPIVIH